MSLVFGFDLQFFLTTTIRLAVACLLGGIIGYERENMHRPAGFRTHILVCVGSALVMVTSEYIFKGYGSHVNTDPARLGAQVISGIGFLGAGTIIREGFSVKGLTTAASVWAVSCVGLAVGIGFYQGAIMATLFIFLTLIGLKKMEPHFAKKANYKVIYVESVNVPGQLGLIGEALSIHGSVVKNIEFIKGSDSSIQLLKLQVKIPEGFETEIIENDIRKLEGVKKVFQGN